MRCSKARNTIQSFEPVSGSFLLCDQKLDVDRDMRKPRRIERFRRNVEGQRCHGKKVPCLRFGKIVRFRDPDAVKQPEALLQVRNDRFVGIRFMPEPRDSTISTSRKTRMSSLLRGELMPLKNSSLVMPIGSLPAEVISIRSEKISNLGGTSLV